MFDALVLTAIYTGKNWEIAWVRWWWAHRRLIFPRFTTRWEVLVRVHRRTDSEDASWPRAGNLAPEDFLRETFPRK